MRPATSTLDLPVARVRPTRTLSTLHKGEPSKLLPYEFSYKTWHFHVLRSENGPLERSPYQSSGIYVHAEKLCASVLGGTSRLALGLQIAQSRSYLYTLGPKVGTQRLQSSSFFVMTFFLLRDHNIQPKKELLWSLWVVFIYLQPLGLAPRTTLEVVAASVIEDPKDQISA